MKISFIALNISGAETAQAAADLLREQLADYGECDYQLCGAAQQVSAALNRAFSGQDLIVLGAEPAEYARIKLAVLRAMRIKTALNDDVAQRLKAKPDLDGKLVAMHAAVPADATVFLSETGFCSGFAIQSGRQFFLMLPLEKHAAQAMLQTGVLPYFEEHGFEKIGRPAAEGPEPAEEPAPAAALPQAELLRSLNKKVYFAAAPALEGFCARYGKGNEDVFIFDSYSAQRNGESPKSFLADLSRYAIPPEETNAFGAAISNVFTGVSQSGEQRYNVYIALSDGSSSRVIRFLSQPEETPEELTEAAYEMLLSMIEAKCQEALENQAQADDGDEPVVVEPDTPAQQQTRKRSAVTTIVFAVLAVLIALAVFLFFHGMNNARNSSADAKQALESNAAQRAEEAEEDTDLASWFGASLTEENTETAEETEG